MATAPQIGNTFWDMSKYFMDQVSHVLNKLNNKREQLSAKITCQLAVTEYGGSKLKMFRLCLFNAISSILADVEACQDTLSTKNKMNLNFTLNLDDR